MICITRGTISILQRSKGLVYSLRERVADFLLCCPNSTRTKQILSYLNNKSFLRPICAKCKCALKDYFHWESISRELHFLFVQIKKIFATKEKLGACLGLKSFEFGQNKYFPRQRLVVALMKSFRSKRQQIHSYLAVHYHSIFDPSTWSGFDI